jgi:hypothetical protein
MMRVTISVAEHEVPVPRPSLSAVRSAALLGVPLAGASAAQLRFSIPFFIR